MALIRRALAAGVLAALLAGCNGGETAPTAADEPTQPAKPPVNNPPPGKAKSKYLAS